MPTIARIDQLRGDPDPVASLAHAALEHVADAKRLGHVGHRDRCFLVDEGRVTRDHVQLGQLREVSNDVLADPVGEILLFGITAHVVEREHGNGSLVGNRRRRGSGRRATSQCGYLTLLDDNAEYLDRPHDVLDSMIAAILDADGYLVAYLVGGGSRDEDAAGLRQTFNAGGDVHAVTIDILAIDDDVADVNSYPKLDPFIFSAAGIVLANRFLNLDRAGDGIDRAGEFDERPIAHQFDHATRMLGDRRVDDLAPQRLEARQRSFLIALHETRIANHIGRKDGRESPLNTR